jgi:hypothetical protein
MLVVSNSSNFGKVGAELAKDENFSTSQLLAKVCLAVLASNELFEALTQIGFLLLLQTLIVVLVSMVTGSRR